DFELKSAKAKEYYNEGSYAKALPLLDQLLTVQLGTPQEEEIRYYIAYCYYGQSQFLISSALFKNFFTAFPKSYRAEECLYMSAFSLYKASPRYNLDQTTTYKALTEFQYFTDTYKKSERVAEANLLMDALRAKLELKMFESAELYFKTENYLAAATNYQNLLKEFPETARAEEIYLQIIRAYFNYAELSVVCKKSERYDLVMESYQEFIERYPQSKLAGTAKGFNDRSAFLKTKSDKEKENYNCDEQS
ncbi:MAG: outer membrane protein assembly factor BamD, partial [Chitinophagales bacterium]